MLELWLLAAVAQAGVTTTVTFDNGEFNAPLYTPRWNGRWRQPSVAQELAQSVARVLHENPEVYSYMPPGRTAGRPGDLFQVLPIAPGCQAPGASPTDPCWCGPSTNCWGGLQANYHPSTSTSLFLSAGKLRRAKQGQGPWVEIHFTDLFEEDPATAEDPSNSDRCVTRAGVRRAIQGLLAPGEGASLDHLAVGLIHVTVDPPPPGASWGHTYELVPVEGGACFSGRKSGSWTGRSASTTMTLGVLVLGMDTAEHDAQVSSLIEGLVSQLDTDRMDVGLVRLREPLSVHQVSSVVRPRDTVPWVVPSASQPPSLPCRSVQGEAVLTSGGLPVDVEEIVADCDGRTSLHLTHQELVSTFLKQAGLDPRREAIQISGTVTLRGDRDAARQALADLAPLNESARPLPLWSAVADAVDPEDGPSPIGPWEQRIEVSALRVTDLDTRPWLLLIVGSVALGLAMGATLAAVLRQLHATRAMRVHWDRAMGPGKDPLRQRPLAVVIAEAQEEVDRQWVIRGTLGGLVGTLGTAVSLWLLMQLYRVVIG